MRAYGNYILAAALCVAGTVMSALGGNVKWHWLLVSDVNVLIFLFIAAFFDTRRPY